jgi:type II secretory pathway component PulM
MSDLLSAIIGASGALASAWGGQLIATKLGNSRDERLREREQEQQTWRDRVSRQENLYQYRVSAYRALLEALDEWWATLNCIFLCSLFGVLVSWDPASSRRREAEKALAAALIVTSPELSSAAQACFDEIHHKADELLDSIIRPDRVERNIPRALHQFRLSPMDDMIRQMRLELAA